jgi:magnesium transporter
MHNYKRISDRIEELKIDNPRNDSSSLHWVNIVNAGKQEINYLRSHYNFDLSHLRSIAASVINQRPMIFKTQKYLFLVLHFPAIENGRIFPGEVDFFIGHGFLVTVHNKNLPALSHFFNLSKKDPDSLLSFATESSAVLLYEILGRLIDDCYRLLDNNSLEIRDVEDMIFSGEQRLAVEKILLLRRNIINIRKIMQNHKNILKELAKMESSLVDKLAIKKYYDRLVEDSKRLWEMLDNQKEMIEVLNGTNESILNDQTNNIMKTLTIISVIVLPLSLMAGIFGMNAVHMPFVAERHGFWVILGIMGFISILMLSYFKRRRWL